MDPQRISKRSHWAVAPNDSFGERGTWWFRNASPILRLIVWIPFLTRFFEIYIPLFTKFFYIPLFTGFLNFPLFLGWVRSTIQKVVFWHPSTVCWSNGWKGLLKTALGHESTTVSICNLIFPLGIFRAKLVVSLREGTLPMPKVFDVKIHQSALGMIIFPWRNDQQKG